MVVLINGVVQLCDYHDKSFHGDKNWDITMCIISLYRIAQNFGRGKLWQIWRNGRHSPIFYSDSL